jgi:hypothetical protein
MHTHIIDEDAYNCLTRANRAVGMLSTLLSSYGECQDSYVSGEDIAGMLEYIWEDIRTGLEGCEQLPSKASIKPLKAKQ